MMILLILWLILSWSAAAPLNFNVDKEAREEDLVTDDIASVDIVNGDGVESDELHNHREARHVFYGGNIKFTGTIHSHGTRARVNIGSISTNALSQEPHNEPESQETTRTPRTITTTTTTPETTRTTTTTTTTPETTATSPTTTTTTTTTTTPETTTSTTTTTTTTETTISTTTTTTTTETTTSTTTTTTTTTGTTTTSTTTTTTTTTTPGTTTTSTTTTTTTTSTPEFGYWGDWSDWSPCSRTCEQGGDGTQYRARYCVGGIKCRNYWFQIDATVMTDDRPCNKDCRSLWIQSNDMDCWSAGCKAKGLCPSVCGADGYCCREGYDGCPPEAAKASPKYHSCVTKKASCSGTASDWACCSSTSPCQKNEGDCDSDSECAGSLVCGTDNCINPLAHHSADCCIQPVCSNNAINWADCFCEGSTRGEFCTAGQRCTAGTCQSGQRCAGRNFGGRNCCTPENPCDEGEGDCDGPGEGEHDGHDGCKGDLVCGSNNCKQFGTYYHEKDDCCEKQIPSSPPEGQRCSGRNFGEKRCCTPENPCDEGEGDCDGPGDGGDHDDHAGCKGDLVCGSNNCKQFGTYYHEMDDCCQKDIELS